MKIFTVNTNPIRVKVPGIYLGTSSVERDYLVSVKAQNNDVLKFTVHLESGALYSSLPIEALYYDDGRDKELDITKHLTTDILQPYSCIDGDVQFIEYEYLRGYKGL